MKVAVIAVINALDYVRRTTRYANTAYGCIHKLTDTVDSITGCARLHAMIDARHPNVDRAIHAHHDAAVLLAVHLLGMDLPADDAEHCPACPPLFCVMVNAIDAPFCSADHAYAALAAYAAAMHPFYADSVFFLAA